MLKAEKLKDYDPKKFKPGYVSEKHNGIHGTYNPHDKQIYSRTPNVIRGLDHIEEGLFHFGFKDQMYIQGEIVIPGLDFETASGKIRSHESTPEAEFYVFNCLFGDERDKDFPFFQRLSRLYWYFNTHWLKKETQIQLVDFQFVYESRDYDAMHEMKEVFGAEGTCWINQSHINAPGMRRWDWMKRISLKEKEVKIIDIRPGTKGKKYEYSLGSFVCVDEENRQFSVGIFKGQTDKWRQEIYNERENYIGEDITVIFKNYTSRGVPYQPRFKAFRWDI